MKTYEESIKFIENLSLETINEICKELNDRAFTGEFKQNSLTKEIYKESELTQFIHFERIVLDVALRKFAKTAALLFRENVALFIRHV